MKKILIIALSGLGDALMFTPALKLLKSKLPDAQIDALVMFKGVKDIYERNQNLSNINYFDFIEEGFPKSLKYLLKLRNKYDYSINVYPSNRKEYNLISFIISAKKRAAIKYLRKDKKNLGFLSKVRILENDSLHNVEENIKLVEKLLNVKFDEKPDLEFPLNESDILFAKNYLENKKIKNDEIIIGFHPGSAVFKNHIRRRWEQEKFAELGKRIIKDFNGKVLIFGGPEENELKKSITEKINSPNAFSVEAGNLAESAAVMKQCNVFVSNDSSLMHVASALKLNVVAILGPTNPSYIHPWNTDYKIIRLNLDCSPCFIYSPRPLICFR
ncbi:MAG: glycosyltransferase family 9 protein, partial [Ignavibacteriaceae bacterium]